MLVFETADQRKTIYLLLLEGGWTEYIYIYIYMYNYLYIYIYIYIIIYNYIYACIYCKFWSAPSFQSTGANPTMMIVLNPTLSVTRLLW